MPVFVRLLGCALALWIVAIVSGPGLAQQTDVSTYRLFEGSDDIEPIPDVLQRLANAIRNAQVPDGCPLGRLKIRVPQGDPMFQPAAVGARRDNLLARLEQLGLRVAGRLFVETTVVGGPEGHDTIYEAPRDRKGPQLTTTWAPAKGTKVKPGDRITITMVARDDPAPWPTGLKSIQLVADSENGRFLAAESYQPCADPPVRRVVATYTVPPNPPLIVRLTALAEDHARHTDTEVAEFPTEGDWYGTLEWYLHAKEDTTRPPNANRSESKFEGRADLVLHYDGRGNLTGTLRGQWEMKTFWWGYPHGNGEVCKGSVPYAPVTADLVGSYTPGPETMTVRPTNMQATFQIPWTGGGRSLRCEPNPFPYDYAAGLTGLFAGGLTRAPDGSYSAGFDDSNPARDFRYSLKLRRVQPPQ